MTALICWNYFGIHSGTFLHLMKCLIGQAGSGGEALELTRRVGAASPLPGAAAPGAPNAQRGLGPGCSSAVTHAEILWKPHC